MAISPKGTPSLSYPPCLTTLISFTQCLIHLSEDLTPMAEYTFIYYLSHSTKTYLKYEGH